MVEFCIEEWIYSEWFGTQCFLEFVSDTIAQSLLPARSKGAALLALTGDRPFLTYIASAASRLGYELNEFGLWCWRGNGTSNKSDDTSRSDAETDATTPDGEKQSAGDVSSGHNGDGKGYWELIASTTEEDIFEELGLQFVVPERRNFAFISPRERKVRKKA
jgi:DNA polymerase beta